MYFEKEKKKRIFEKYLWVFEKEQKIGIFSDHPCKLGDVTHIPTSPGKEVQGIEDTREIFFFNNGRNFEILILIFHQKIEFAFCVKFPTPFFRGKNKNNIFKFVVCQESVKSLVLSAHTYIEQA